MCKFLSSIGFKNGDIICDPSIDSHEDLVQQHDLKESKLRNWIRLEYYPEKDDQYHLIEKYQLHIDDDLAQWLTEDLKKQWIKKLNAKLKRVIITKDTHCLSSGTFILSNNVTINKILYGRIISAGYATIEYAGNATIKNARYATIENAGNATIENAGNATIENAENAKIS